MSKEFLSGMDSNYWLICGVLFLAVVFFGIGVVLTVMDNKNGGGKIEAVATKPNQEAQEEEIPYAIPKILSVALRRYRGKNHLVFNVLANCKDHMKKPVPILQLDDGDYEIIDGEQTIDGESGKVFHLIVPRRPEVLLHIRHYVNYQFDIPPQTVDLADRLWEELQEN